MINDCESEVVYVHGSYYGNNFGDVLLVDLYAKRIREMGYDVSYPFADSGYKKLTGFNTGKVSRGKVIAGVFCGGGYFGEPSAGKRFWSIRNTYRHGRAYIFYSRNRIPYAISAVGFGPITYQPFKSIAIRSFDNAFCSSVRDQESLNYLREYGVDRDVELLSDAVLSLSRSDIPADSMFEATNFLKKINAKTFVGVHLVHKFKSDSDFDEVVSGFNDAVDSMGEDVHLIFFCDGKSRTGRSLKQVDDARKIYASIPKEKYSVWEYTDHWGLVALISQLDMVVTTKLHVGIVSCALGVNISAIPYHSKTTRFYSQVKMPERCYKGEVKGKNISDFLKSNFSRDNGILPSEVVSSSMRNFEMLRYFLSRFSDKK